MLEPRRAIPKPIDIEQILKSHRLAQQHHKNYKEAAIATGELLHVVKDGLPHGEFGPWLKEHCAEIKRSTAARYMRLARQISTGVEISSLSRAYGIKTKPYRQWTAAAFQKQFDKLIERQRREYSPPPSDEQLLHELRENVKRFESPHSAHDPKAADDEVDDVMEMAEPLETRH